MKITFWVPTAWCRECRVMSPVGLRVCAQPQRSQEPLCRTSARLPCNTARSAGTTAGASGFAVLLPHPSGVIADEIEPAASAVIVRAGYRPTQAQCPVCGTP